MEIVNPVPLDEAEPWLVACFTTLLNPVHDDDFAQRVARWQRDWRADRTWGVRDRGRWVATLATDARTMTVPAPAGATAELSFDALTAVTVAATHRRQGLLRRMIALSLQAAVDRGDALTALIAAEWPIYGRFGYAPAVRSADYRYFPRLRGASVERDPAGSTRQVEPAELAAVAPAIFERSRLRYPGQVTRAGAWWSLRFGVDGYKQPAAAKGTWLVHESSDGADGLLGWRVTRDFELNGDMGAIEVIDLVAGSDRAYRNLWAYLGSIDVVSEVTLHERALDEPVRWLLGDGRALRQISTDDHTWLRLLDVPVALAARGYGVAGQLVLEVVDDAPGGYAAGRYLLDASLDGASCVRTTRSADLQLSQRTLAAVYLGDHSLRALSVAGGIDELVPGALARADAMFATSQRPWNATPF